MATSESINSNIHDVIAINSNICKKNFIYSNKYDDVIYSSFYSNKYFYF